MAKLFRGDLWLADPSTQKHYQHLIEFVGLGDRWLAKSLPVEVIERLGHSAEKLKQFYEHFRQKHDTRRGKIEKGNA